MIDCWLAAIRLLPSSLFPPPPSTLSIDSLPRFGMAGPMVSELLDLFAEDARECSCRGRDEVGGKEGATDAVEAVDTVAVVAVDVAAVAAVTTAQEKETADEEEELEMQEGEEEEGMSVEEWVLLLLIWEEDEDVVVAVVVERMGTRVDKGTAHV